MNLYIRAIIANVAGFSYTGNISLYRAYSLNVYLTISSKSA